MPAEPYCLIPLRGRGGVVRDVVKVDGADFAWLNQRRWHLVPIRTGCRYARDRDGVYMHRAILGLEPGDAREADHINGEGLDNRRANLRAVSHRHNQQNPHARQKAMYSQYRGVTRERNPSPLTRPWIAAARGDSGMVHIGRFAAEIDAAAAAAQWRHAHMPGAIEDPSLLARVLPTCTTHGAIIGFQLRALEIEHRWNAGETMREIATALGRSERYVGHAMWRMRSLGYDLPYRGPRH